MKKFLSQKFKNREEKGASLYFVVLILSVLMAAFLSLIALSVSQLKISQGVNDSINAFFAADSGIEHSLYNLLKEEGAGSVFGQTGEAVYDVSVTTNGETIVKSIGTFKNTKRAIEAKY